MISTEIKIKLHKTFKQLLPACDMRVIFKVSLCIRNYLNFKDKIKQELRSLFIILSVIAAMLNTLVNQTTLNANLATYWLVSHHSQGNVLKKLSNFSCT